MNWTDEGIVLSARKHGESAAIVTLLTRENGRHSGLVRGGYGSRVRGIYQTGNLVCADSVSYTHLTLPTTPYV